MPSIQRQVPGTFAKAKSTRYDSRMPEVTASWLNDTRPPRRRGGETSDTYMGDTNDAVPTDSPRRNRKPMSMGTLTDSAQPMAAMA